MQRRIQAKEGVEGIGLNMITKSDLHQERRGHPRLPLDLPFEYRTLDIPSVYGGIVVNGGEGGFLIYSIQDLRIGTRLNVTVLFADECELATFQALAQIVRKENREKWQEGFRYGVKLVHINEEDRSKLKHILQ